MFLFVCSFTSGQGELRRSEKGVLHSKRGGEIEIGMHPEERVVLGSENDNFYRKNIDR
jgi:hypothetical protein